jgi:hypothetical protein
MNLLWIAAIAASTVSTVGPGSRPIFQDPAPVRPVQEPEETPVPSGETAQGTVDAPPAVPAPQAVPEPARTEPVAGKPPVYEARYHTLEEVESLVAGWIASASPGRVLAESVEMPATGTGLPVPAFAFGAAGPMPLAERPTMLLVGGLDGISLAGSEAVLAACAACFADPAGLPRDLALLAIPWGSPEALEDALAGRGQGGMDHTPIDDDGDGRVDEDGPDDLDGDGKILDMLIEDPAGSWARASDPRFLARARPGDAPRYVLVREGKDDDHDGRFNEDPLGGVVYDTSFPIGWSPVRPLARGSLMPLEVPVCRALADLALERHVVLVLLFQGNTGGLGSPGARRENPWPAGADAAAFEVLGRLFARATGRAGPPPAAIAEASGAERPGAALDWFYAVPGALALEVAPWGPSVEKPGEAGGVGLTDALFQNPARGAGRPGAPPVGAVDLAWGRWLDNTRGGIGFVEWHPVELGDGRQALVGGWEARSRRTPPEKSLAAALAGLPEFVQAAASALPTLELRLAEVRRDGEVCTIRARLTNHGALPTSCATSGHAPGGRRAGEPGAFARLELELPTGARLLAGEPRVELGQIAGAGASREVAWVVLAPAGSVMTVRASAPFTLPIQREVKP